MLPNYADSSDNDLFRDVNRPFNATNYAEMEGRRRCILFMLFSKLEKGKRFPPAASSSIGKPFLIMQTTRWRRITSENDWRDYQLRTVWNVQYGEDVAGSFPMVSELYSGKIVQVSEWELWQKKFSASPYPVAIFYLKRLPCPVQSQWLRAC